MNFDFSDDQKMLQQTARTYLAEHAPLSICRSVLESEQLYARDLWKGVGELGWLGTAIPEEFGGAGFGHLETAVLAEEIGRSLAPIPFASSVYLATEALLIAGSESQKKKYLPKLASGSAIGTLAVAERPGQNGIEGIRTTFDGRTVSGTKLPVLDGEAADFAVVVVTRGTTLSLVIVDLNGDGIQRSAVKSFDPSRPLAKLVFNQAPAELLGSEGQGASLTDRILDRAAVLMAFEQIGAAQRAFEITRDYTLGRYAFGRPIASNQAIKHNLANLWCGIELARSNAYYGAWALSNDDPELTTASGLARVSASEAFDRMSAEMIQLHGGVGYTWEYDCHLFYRRAKLLSAILGSTSSWRAKLIDRLATRSDADAA